MIRNNRQIPQMQRSWSLPMGQSLLCPIGTAVAVTEPKAELCIPLDGEKIDEAVTTNRGDRYNFGSVCVRVLNNAIFYEDEHNPGNDSGVIFKIEPPGESVLMLGAVAYARNARMDAPPRCAVYLYHERRYRYDPLRGKLKIS